MSQAISLPADKNSSRVTFGRVLKSEWIKFWSLKSTWWITSVTFVIIVGFSALVAWGVNTGFSKCSDVGSKCTAADFAQLKTIHLTTALQGGAAIGTIVMSILGVLLVTNEYSSGMIRSTLAAVPRRTPVLLAKSLVMGVISYILIFITSWLGLFAAYPIISGNIKKYGNPANTVLFSKDSLHVAAGISLVVALIAMLALAIGFMIRNTGGSIGAVVGLLFVVSILTQMLPWQWVHDMGQYIPNQAGASLYTLNSGQAAQGLLPFWTGLGTLVAWAVIPLIFAAVVLKKRDAK